VGAAAGGAGLASFPRCTPPLCGETNRLPATAPNAYPVPVDQLSDVVVAVSVLANDTDADGDVLRAASWTQPLTGTLIETREDGSFRYRPAPGFTGDDTFTYRATDGVGQSVETTVTMKVGAPLDRPVAADDAFSTGRDVTLATSAPGILGNDSDPNARTLTATLVTSTSAGLLLLRPDGSFSFRPSTGFVGTAEFSYRASNGSTLSEVVIARIVVDDSAPPTTTTTTVPSTTVPSTTTTSTTTTSTTSTVPPTTTTSTTSTVPPTTTTSTTTTVPPTTTTTSTTPTTTTTTVPPVADSATVTVNGATYTSGPAGGGPGFSIQSNGSTVSRVSGRLTFPGRSGGTASLSVAVNRFAFLTLGTVTFSDPGASVRITGYVFSGTPLVRVGNSVTIRATGVSFALSSGLVAVPIVATLTDNG